MCRFPSVLYSKFLIPPIKPGSKPVWRTGKGLVEGAPAVTQVWCCILLRLCTAKHLLSRLSLVVANTPCVCASVSTEVSQCPGHIDPGTAARHKSQTNTASVANNGFPYNRPGFLPSPRRLWLDVRKYNRSPSDRSSFSACFWAIRSWVAQCVVSWFELSVEWSLSISGWDACPEFCEFHSERDVSVSKTWWCKSTPTLLSPTLVSDF